MSINKLDLVRYRMVTGLVGVFGNGGGLSTGESYIPVVLFDPILHRSPCFAAFFPFFPHLKVSLLTAFRMAGFSFRGTGFVRGRTFCGFIWTGFCFDESRYFEPNLVRKWRCSMQLLGLLSSSLALLAKPFMVGLTICADVSPHPGPGIQNGSRISGTHQSYLLTTWLDTHGCSCRWL